MPYKTQKEGVVTVFNEEEELIAILYREAKSRKNVFYACTEMGLEDLENLVGADTVKPTVNKNWEETIKKSDEQPY